MFDDPEQEKAYVERWAVILERQKQYEKKNPRSTWGSGPAFAEALNERLEVLRRLHEDADQHAILLAVRECAAGRLPMPDWLAVAFCDAYAQVRNREARSWDDVFGKPVPKGMKIADWRMRQRLMTVEAEVNNMMALGQAQTLEEAFGRLVDRGFGSRTTVTDAYYGRIGKAHSAKKQNGGKTHPRAELIVSTRNPPLLLDTKDEPQQSALAASPW